MKHGFGHYKWADNQEYQGDWVENKITGKGTFKWADGREYEGEW